MPLQKKPISHSQTYFLTWLCCLPCTAVTALCCMATCQCGAAAQCICFPCLDESLKDKADTIASVVLVDNNHPKQLTALNGSTLTATDILKFDNQWHMTLYGKIKEDALKVLNNYNFGTVQSENLTDDQVRAIGYQIRENLFAELPSPDDFYSDFRKKGIRNEEFDGFLAATLMNILKNNFIFKQFELASTRIQAATEGYTPPLIQRGLFGTSMRNTFVKDKENAKKPSLELTIPEEAQALKDAPRPATPGRS